MMVVTTSILACHTVTGALRDPLIRKANRGQHTVGDCIDADRAADERRVGPAIRIEGCVVHMSVHDEIRAHIVLGKAWSAPDHGVPCLLRES